MEVVLRLENYVQVDALTVVDVVAPVVIIVSRFIIGYQFINN